jgi:hypothetical protein
MQDDRTVLRAVVPARSTLDLVSPAMILAKMRDASATDRPGGM